MPSNNPVISNNTPLVALSVLNQLDLLAKLFGTILIPPAVYEEFTATESIARQIAFENAPWLQITQLDSPQHALAFAGLDKGEAEVLALAQEKQARLVIIDERRGRRYAQRLRLSLTGTLGVLLLAKERNLLPFIEPSIAKLQQEGLYLSPALVAQVLNLAGESQSK
ncbi:MAG TPA: DUF3368 domain-containing protein [Anaerolineae bacterium]|nr:DUF3368 domain-containing protein [Anaerolineae bacterium]